MIFHTPYIRDLFLHKYHHIYNYLVSKNKARRGAGKYFSTISPLLLSYLLEGNQSREKVSDFGLWQDQENVFYVRIEKELWWDIFAMIGATKIIFRPVWLFCIVLKYEYVSFLICLIMWSCNKTKVELLYLESCHSFLNSRCTKILLGNGVWYAKIFDTEIELS